MIENKTPLTEDALDGISGGTASPGAVMMCKTDAPLYSSNPAGNHFRSTTNLLDTVQSGSVIRLYEYGTRYCKVIVNGKIGWVETANLVNK